jgi:hypothetical protein
MAHGFRYVPSARTASEPDYPRCPFCFARTDIGMPPHLCKETTFGTAVSPQPFLSLAPLIGQWSQGVTLATAYEQCCGNRSGPGFECTCDLECGCLCAHCACSPGGDNGDPN